MTILNLRERKVLSRGIIITPSYLKSTSKTPVPPYIDSGFLRKCILYWDMIDCLDDALGGLDVISDKSELDLLTTEGIFQRTSGYLFTTEDEVNKLSFYAEHPYEFCEIGQLYALKRHSLSGLSERWSIGNINTRLSTPVHLVSRFIFLDREGVGPQKPNNILAMSTDRYFNPEKDLEIKTVVGIELFRCLPVPDHDVPLEKILEFKHKRFDELLRFRHKMDELYDKAINSKDVSGAIEYAVDEIGMSLRDINNAMSESFGKKILSTLKIELDIKDAAIGALTGGLIGSQFNLSLLGAVTGVTISAIRISLDSSLLRPKQFPSELKDYSYIYYAEKLFGAFSK